MDQKYSKYVSWFGRILVLLSIVFIANKLLEYRQQLVETSSSATTWVFILALAVTYGLFKFISANGWYYLLMMNKALNHEISRLEAVIVYGKTHIAKYVPGNIFHYTSRHIFARKYNLSDSYLITTTFIEIMIVISIAGMYSLLGIKQIVFHLQTVLPSFSGYVPVLTLIVTVLGLATVFFLGKRYSIFGAVLTSVYY